MRTRIRYSFVSIFIFLLFFTACDKEKEPLMSDKALHNNAIEYAGNQNTSMKFLSLGANFNEEIADIDNDLLENAGVKWVRGFVNINRLFLNYTDERGIWGVRSQAITNFQPIIPFINAKKTATENGRKVKLIFSLKLQFKNRNMGVPEPGSKGMDLMMKAIEEFLLAKNLGREIAVLVLGNEPMWETPLEDVANYEYFLNSLIDSVGTWKKKNEWDFKTYIGALNRVSEVRQNAIGNKVLEIAKNNNKIDGLDIHMHVDDILEIEDDLKFIREDMGITKSLICTEFSIVRLFNQHSNDLLGKEFASQYGYPENTRIFQWLNSAMVAAQSGTPISATEFEHGFKTRDWYPDEWFFDFIKAFKKYDVDIATYRLQSHVRDPLRLLDKNSAMWSVNAPYNGELLGYFENGFPNKNPLVIPEYETVLKVH
ncbi:hypothetical protein [Sinomicrobium sp. M5D2P17]